MSLKLNVIKNAFSTVLQKGVRVLEQLLLVPFFISTWGAAYYGEWITLTIIPSILAFSDFGFGTATSNTFVLEYVSGKLKDASNTSRTGFISISGLIVLSLILCFLVVKGLIFFKFFETSLISGNDALIAVSILIFARLINFYSQMYEGYYRAARRASLSINLFSIKSLFNLISGFIVLKMGFGIIAFSISQLVVSVLFNLLYSYHAISILSPLRFYKGEFNYPIFRNTISVGFSYLMGPIWQTIYFQGTTLAVRVTLGPESVTIFNTVRTLSRSLNQFFSMVNVSIFPELQFEIGKGNLVNARKLLSVAMFSVFCIGFIGCVFLKVFGLEIYNIWTGGVLKVPVSIWNIFVLSVFINAIWWTISVVFRAFNRPRQFTVFGLFFSICSVTVTYILAFYYGLFGASVGYLLFDVLMLMFLLPKGLKLIQLSYSEIFIVGFDGVTRILFSVKKKLKKYHD